MCSSRASATDCLSHPCICHFPFEGARPGSLRLLSGRTSSRPINLTTYGTTFITRRDGSCRTQIHCRPGTTRNAIHHLPIRGQVGRANKATGARDAYNQDQAHDGRWPIASLAHYVHILRARRYCCWPMAQITRLGRTRQSRDHYIRISETNSRLSRSRIEPS